MGTHGSSSIGPQLLKLKERLEEAKQNRSELQGELKSIMAQLKQEFNVGSLEEANQQVAEYAKEIKKMEESINAQIEEVKELMDEGEDDYAG